MMRRILTPHENKAVFGVTMAAVFLAMLDVLGNQSLGGGIYRICYSVTLHSDQIGGVIGGSDIWKPRAMDVNGALLHEYPRGGAPLVFMPGDIVDMYISFDPGVLEICDNNLPTSESISIQVLAGNEHTPGSFDYEIEFRHVAPGRVVPNPLTGSGTFNATGEVMLSRDIEYLSGLAQFKGLRLTFKNLSQLWTPAFVILGVGVEEIEIIGGGPADRITIVDCRGRKEKRKVEIPPKSPIEPTPEITTWGRIKSLLGDEASPSW